MATGIFNNIPGPSGNSAVLQAVGTGAYNGAELAVDLIQAQVQSNIVQALLNVRTARIDNSVTTEAPIEYYTYATARVYRCPTVFTIVQDMDFRDESSKGNHLNSLDRIVVAVVVEDRLERDLEVKAWRYQAALMQCLHHVTLTSADGTLRIFSRVKRCQFSGVINIKDDKAPEAVFRKEVSVELNVEHVENFE